MKTKPALFALKLFLPVMMLLQATVVSLTANAQPPNISYANPQSFTQGVAISAVSPTNTGGAVAGPGYLPAHTVSFTFSNPYGIASDAAGNMYVADYGSGFLLKFATGSSSPTVIDTGFNHPKGVALDKAGNIYVADAGNHAIKKVAAGGGTPIAIGPSFSSPVGLAADNSGNLFVTDNATNNIYELPAGGGSRITLATGFGNPQGIVVNAAGDLFVCDVSSGVIKIPAGSRGNRMAYGTGLNEPVGLTLDGAGNLFVTDAGSLYKILPGGGTTTLISSLFNSAYGVAVDGTGKIFATDNGNNLMLSILPKGGYYISPSIPTGLNFSGSTGAFGGKPLLPMAATTYTVVAYGPSGTGTATISIQVASAMPSVSYTSPQTYHAGQAITALSPAGSGVDAPVYLANPVSLGYGYVKPYGVTIDAAGNIYVADTYNSRIVKLPAGGSAQLALNTGMMLPTSVAADAAGNVYFTTQTGLYKIPAGGGSPVPVGSGFSDPTGVALDAAGNIYVADNGNNAVKKLPAGGGSAITLGSGFSTPSGVSVDAVGNVYVADEGNNAVKKIPVGGGSIVTLGSGFSGPVALAVDGLGNVFVADGGNNAIKEIKITGGAPVTLASGFSAPNGVAADATGKVYVADYGNNAVKEIIPGGGYYISTMLPAGLTFSGSTGAISGTPSAITPAANYIVTAYNKSGSAQAAINIKVQSSSNANLASIGSSITPLTPVFAPNTTSYTLTVSNTTASMTLTPVTSNTEATLTVNGTALASGTKSAPIALAVGSNTITVVVTSQDGTTTKTYVITVTRSLSNNAGLSAMNPQYGPLSPVFNTNTTSYTLAVANSKASITVAPVTSEAHATLTVNGTALASGATSPAIALAVGANKVNVAVTAQDGVTQKAYNITVTRAASGADGFDPESVSQPIATVTMVDELKVHLGVSPNGDGIEDFLQIDNISQYPDNRLSIMNRNGQLVFEARGYDNSTKVFDGHSNKNGNMQLPGTYFYQLDYTVNGVVKHKTGFIVLKY